MKKLSILTLGIALLFSCNQAKTNSVNSNKNNTNIELKEEIVIKQKKTIEVKSDTSFTFETYETGKLPESWSQYFTGKGESTEWKIADDNGNKVLAQLSSGKHNYHFNEVVFNEISAKNVELEVRMKGVAGKMDQGGGFVWRFTDADNYYVVRANPLEDNVVLYKVKDGKRTDLPLIDKGRTYGADVEKLGNDYNTLKILVVDNIFTVYLNDKEIFKVKDDTFTNAGKIGLWTKADAVSYFDDFVVKVLD